SHVDETSAGRGLIASETVEQGTVVERLEGRPVAYSKIPEADLRNAFDVDDDRWIIPLVRGRRLNHSCDPNCYISTTLDVTPSRRVHKGEELTIMYNEVTLDKYMKSNAILPKWDDRRSFDCQCGTPRCMKRIDRYVVPVPNDPNAKGVRMSVVPGHG